MDMEPATIPVVLSATPTEAPRVSPDTMGMVATDTVSTRGRLRLPMDMELLPATIMVVEAAIPTGAPRASLPTGDMVASDTGSTRGRLRLLTMAWELPLMPLSPALTTPTDME